MAIPFHFQSGQFAPPAMLSVDSFEATRTGDVDEETKRSCGGCRACCIHLPIPAGDVCAERKPAGVACPHLACNGCGIYDARPSTCRQFECAWLADRSWPDAWRPDRSGLLCLREDISADVPAAVVYEIERDAIGRETAEAILGRLRQSTAIVAFVNAQQQRRLIHDTNRLESGHELRRPHFLRSINAIRANARGTDALRDAS